MDESDSPAPAPDAAPRAIALPPRPDAFTPDHMARFCEVLAETGIVTIACKAVGRSRDTAYAHRRRNPLFAAAWAAALSHARNRLADALLERSIAGSVDYLYRDGELVGERRYIDNRLAYSMLRRLDKQAEAVPLAGAAAAGAAAAPRAPTDWSVAIRALRTGSEEDLCAALALVAGDAGEPDTPDNPDTAPDPENPDEMFPDNCPFATDRVWRVDGDWWTSFPPPPGFDRDEDGHWESDDYQRQCSREEAALLTAALEDSLAEERAQAEAERDRFFGSLHGEAAQ